ncbi:MAG: hypothetical protein M3R44_03905 [Candidatus Eremiobacteraeota bacterium]|nr:hypothetical protein [Candidatus Eremiobacteraeota bacterium]
MVKGLIWGGIGFAAAFAAERVSSSLLTDLKRYDMMRAMSGDPPFLVELGKMAGTMLMPIAGSRKGEAVSELSTLQSDLMRYVRIRSM